MARLGGKAGDGGVEAAKPERKAKASGNPSADTTPDSGLASAEAALHWQPFYAAVRSAIAGMRTADETAKSGEPAANKRR